MSLDVNQYPLPRPEDLFASLAGGQRYSKIDLSHAYQQMMLDDNSRELITINTHKGLYQYTRLPFGVAPAPALFQRAMDTILQGIPSVICYINDIVVTGKSYEEHLKNLEAVLKRLSDEGMTAKRNKCSFMKESIEFLGHIIDSKGIHPSQAKLEAILNAPKPKNVQQLRSLLRLVNYYGKFVPQLASIFHPLNRLLGNGVKWQWSVECDKVLDKVKQELVSPRVLVHFNSELPVTLATDASPYGIGAVISHVYPDGSEQPIAFASRTLTSAERNYAQIEKEALSVVFGVKKFHQYLFGRKFSLVTDHKPKKAIPPLAAARIQRWSVILSAYNYDISFRSTKLHANADALSRLPLSPTTEAGTYTDRVCSVFNVGQMEALPVTSSQLAKATSTDPVLSKVVRFTRNGWPDRVPDTLKPFYNRRSELSIEGNCIMWGIRVIVPQKLRGKVLQELHSEHPGMSRMKAIACSFVWWPNLDANIESLVKSCVPCLSVKSAPPKSPLNPWLWPAKTSM